MTTKLKALAVQAAVNAKTWEFWREFAICLGKAVMAAGFGLLLIAGVGDMTKAVQDAIVDIGLLPRIILIGPAFASPVAVMWVVYRLFFWQCHCERGD